MCATHCVCASVYQIPLDKFISFSIFFIIQIQIQIYEHIFNILFFLFAQCVEMTCGVGVCINVIRIVEKYVCVNLQLLYGREWIV